MIVNSVHRIEKHACSHVRLFSRHHESVYPYLWHLAQIILLLLSDLKSDLDQLHLGLMDLLYSIFQYAAVMFAPVLSHVSMGSDVATAKTVESTVDPHRILASQPTAALDRKP